MRHILLIAGIILSTDAFHGPMATANRIAFGQIQKSLSNNGKISKPTTTSSATSTAIPRPEKLILINNSSVNYGIDIVHTISIGIIISVMFMIWTTV